ncbi:hypothetical protein BD779DRAFT_1581206, partial [Infundibulicybe gibba]
MIVFYLFFLVCLRETSRVEKVFRGISGARSRVRLKFQHMILGVCAALPSNVSASVGGHTWLRVKELEGAIRSSIIHPQH